MNANEEYCIEMFLLILGGGSIFAVGTITNNPQIVAIGGAWLLGLLVGTLAAEMAR